MRDAKAQYPEDIATGNITLRGKPVRLDFVHDLKFTGGASLPAFAAAEGALVPIEHLSAASGMQVVGKNTYVVADDLLHLGVFTGSDFAAGKAVRWHPLPPNHLPADATARKAVKPDIEALARLLATRLFPTGALLGVPSGSAANRMHGFAWALDHTGSLQGEAKPVDFTQLYSRLKELLGKELNIEGMAVHPDKIRLFNRGTGDTTANAMVDLSLKDVVGAIDRGEPLPASAVRDINFYTFDKIDGAALTITDAAPLDDNKTVITLAAELTKSTIDDGPVKGSAYGIIDAANNVEVLRRLDTGVNKIEAVAQAQAGTRKFYFATDNDSPTQAARLFSADLP